MDSWDGNAELPASLHLYLYSSNNPVNRVDPSGKFDFSLGSISITLGFQGTIFGLSTVNSVILMQGVLGGLLAASTAGFGAYLEGGSPGQIEETTGNLFNIGFGVVMGITGSRIASFTWEKSYFPLQQLISVGKLHIELMSPDMTCPQFRFT